MFMVVRDRVYHCRLRAKGLLMSRTRTFWATCFVILALFSARIGQAQTQLGVSVANGQIIKDGVPYRGIGVNYFDSFYRNMTNASDTSYVQGFNTLQQHNIPFVRFSLSGYWPNDFKLYMTNKPEFYHRLDAYVNSAAQHHIGLVPSFYWTDFMIPDLVHEPVSAWGDPSSATRSFMRSFTAEVVDRYKGSPAIWGWEFGNEYNLSADLPNASEWRPPIQPMLGTPTTRSAADDLTGNMINSAMVDFATVVHQHDSGRMISSGDALMRPSAYHQYTSLSWDTDTTAQQSTMYDLFNPSPMNTIGGHPYDLTGWDTPINTAKAEGKATFFGEFGVLGNDSAAMAEFHDMLQMIADKKVDLAAVWNFDRQQSGDPWSISASPNGTRSWQLDQIQAMNLLIPEPSTFILSVLGMIALLVVAKIGVRNAP